MIGANDVWAKRTIPLQEGLRERWLLNAATVGRNVRAKVRVLRAGGTGGGMGGSGRGGVAELAVVAARELQRCSAGAGRLAVGGISRGAGQVER